MITLFPYPAHLKETGNTFNFSKSMTVWLDDEFQSIKKFLDQALKAELVHKGVADADFCFVQNKMMAEEQYKLIITDKKVSVEAATKVGAFYAIQTIRQLGKFDVEDCSHKIPTVEIRDKPRFNWRGISLDESRHFFGKDTVKRYLDLMAFHKLNVFHWHLTDDQGWRIEVKKYPLLTEVGSKRKDTQINGWNSKDFEGKPHSGFYTQEDIKEIVAYAAERGIMVVPEIDMPAHFAAAMAAYNWLGCREIPCEVLTYFGGKIPEAKGVMDWNRIACAGKESTYEFIFNVIDEVCELFPAPFFHIGGDEAPKDEWKKCPKCQEAMKKNNLKNEEELQGYFNNRIKQYLDEKGKRLIGWNEILTANNLDKSIVGQYWTPKRDKNAEDYVNNGGQLIMSQHQAFYFDMTYSQRPLKDTYTYEPVKKGIKEESKKRILGVEGEVWTEWILDRYKLDMYVFPRMQAFAEVGWTPKSKRDWRSFLKRWQKFKPILDDMGVVYAEDEVSMPKWFKRAKHIKLFYCGDTYSEVKLNKQIRGEK